MQQFDVKGTGTPAPAARTALGDEAPTEPAGKDLYKKQSDGNAIPEFSNSTVSASVTSAACTRLIASGCLFAALLYLNTPFLPAALHPGGGVPLNALLQFALALAVYGLNYTVFLRGAQELRGKHPGAQALMALSGIAALLHGILATAATEELYLVYAAAVLTLAAAGTYIQERSGVSFAAKTKDSAAPFAGAWNKLLAAYTAAALGVAGVSFIIWLLAGQMFLFALARSLAVLAVACPCVLGALVPMTVLFGRKAGEKAGVRFCTAAGMESLGRASTVVLDKTDIIMPGIPAVTEIIGTRNVPAKFLLGMAAGLESGSADPVAQAILQKAAAEGITVRPAANLTIRPGMGMQGTLTRKVMVGGTAEYVSEFCALPPTLTETGAALVQQGVTPLYFALDGHAAGLVGVADVVKADCKPAVVKLKALGLHTVLFTAEAAAVAEYTGGLAGIDKEQIFSSLAPADKSAEAARLQKAGGVILVGGSAEDAALACADCGIARRCVGPAPKSADVLLLQENLTSIPAAVQLSRNLTQTLHTSLLPALLIGTLCLLLAAGVLYPVGVLLTPGMALAAALLTIFCTAGTAVCMVRREKAGAQDDKEPLNE